MSKDATIIKLIRMDYFFTKMSPWLKWKHNIWVDTRHSQNSVRFELFLDFAQLSRKYPISFIYIKINNSSITRCSLMIDRDTSPFGFGMTVRFYRWLHDALNQIMNNQTKLLINFCRMSFIYGPRIFSTRRW